MLRGYDTQIDVHALLWSLWRGRLVVVVVMALALGLTYLGVSMAPRSYESTTSVLTEPRRMDGAAGVEPGQVDGSLVATLVQILRSPDTMLEVVRREQLDRVDEFNGGLSGDDALDHAARTLIGQTTAAADKNSAMIYVRVRSRDRELAQRLALAVAEVALDRRAAMLSDDIGLAADWLAGVIPELRTAVIAAEAAAAAYRTRHDLLKSSESGTLVEQQMAELSARIAAARERSLRLTAQAEHWQAQLAAGEPLSGALDGPGEVRILRQTHADLQSQLARQASQLAPNHPTIRALRDRIAELERQGAEALQRARADVTARATTEMALAEGLEADLLALRQAASAQVSNSVALRALDREATAHRNVLEDYLARYEAARTFADHGTVLPDMRIVTRPRVAASPISPRTSLVLMAGGIMALMAIVAGFIIAGLARRVSLPA